MSLNIIQQQRNQVNVNVKGRSHQLRPKSHILDDPLGMSYDFLKIVTHTDTCKEFYIEEVKSQNISLSKHLYVSE